MTMTTKRTKQELLKKLNEVRKEIKAGVNVDRNRQRERYLVERLKGE